MSDMFRRLQRGIHELGEVRRTSQAQDGPGGRARRPPDSSPISPPIHDSDRRPTTSPFDPVRPRAIHREEPASSSVAAEKPTPPPPIILPTAPPSDGTGKSFLGESIRPLTPPPGLRRTRSDESAAPHPPADRALGEPEVRSTFSKLCVQTEKPSVSTDPLGLQIISQDSTPAFEVWAATKPAPASVTSLALTRNEVRLRERAAEESPAQVAPDVLVALCKAMACTTDRRTNETLELCLTAHMEQTALMVQSFSDQRQDYGAALERTIKRIVEEAAPESLINIGEVFQRSAGEITAALRCGDHTQAKILETLRKIDGHLGLLVARADETARAAADRSAEVRAEKPAEVRVEKPALALVSAGAGMPQDSPLNRLPEDDE